MFNWFLGGVFNKSESKKFLKKVQKLSELTNDLNIKKKELDSVEYELLLEHKDSVYISLHEFLNFMKKEKNLELKDIITSFKHIDELQSKGVSAIEVFIIPEEDGHLTICSDIKTCEKHNSYKGDPVRISTIKRV